MGGANGRFSFIKSHTRTDLTLSSIRLVLERNCGCGFEMQPAGNQLQLPAELNCFSFVTKSTKPSEGCLLEKEKTSTLFAEISLTSALNFLG